MAFDNWYIFPAEKARSGQSPEGLSCAPSVASFHTTPTVTLSLGLFDLFTPVHALGPLCLTQAILCVWNEYPFSTHWWSPLLLQHPRTPNQVGLGPLLSTHTLFLESVDENQVTWKKENTDVWASSRTQDLPLCG